jgi:hypothetical protein
MTWQNWLRGLVAAVITGVSNAFLASVISPDTFNTSLEGLRKLGIMLLLSGALGMATYLKQSPLPTAEEKKTVTTETTVTTTPAPPPEPPKT